MEPVFSPEDAVGGFNGVFSNRCSGDVSGAGFDDAVGDGYRGSFCNGIGEGLGDELEPNVVWEVVLVFSVVVVDVEDEMVVELPAFGRLG